jgi:hypothetical protein
MQWEVGDSTHRRQVLSFFFPVLGYAVSKIEPLCIAACMTERPLQRGCLNALLFLLIHVDPPQASHSAYALHDCVVLYAWGLKGIYAVSFGVPKGIQMVTTHNDLLSRTRHGVTVSSVA